MKHAILGVGAIGGLLGAALASLGESVTAIVRPQSVSAFPPELVLERPSGLLTGPGQVAAALTEAVDVLWIATKAYQLEEALNSVHAPPLSVLPLLNGIDHIPLLESRFGRERVVPGTIAVEAEKTGAGRFLQRSPFVRLNLASRSEARMGAIVQQFRALGFSCEFIPSDATLLWSKLCFLGPFALVTSASSLSIGDVQASPEWRPQLKTAIAEACAVGNASGAAIDPAKIEAAFAGAPSAMRSSMQKDLAAGRKLELDAIGGPIVRAGKRHGLDVSTTASLIATINRASEQISAQSPAPQ
jgi:2-dehydropantoate 2-reductase